MIELIKDNDKKKNITREILDALPEWFEIPEAKEAYINGSTDKIFLAANVNSKHIGFLYLTKTGADTVEIHVMGVLKEWQHQGSGKALIEKAKQIAFEEGYSFMQVKTVQMGKYPEYDRTNRFYLSCGFKEFEMLPELWGEENPCQIYVMYIGQTES